MSALTHSPGFLDFITKVAQVASFIPGPIGMIARPIAIGGTVERIGEGIVHALFQPSGSGTDDALIAAPSRSIGTSFPSLPRGGLAFEEEGEEPAFEEEGFEETPLE